MAYTYPGVYIEEQPAIGPIAGVGTSTAAFIGPAVRGPLLRPTLITNWTQFKNIFGGYMTAPLFYMAYAVKGFFDNGGTAAYIVRAGTGQAPFLALPDGGPGSAQSAKQSLVLRGKQLGPGSQINVMVAAASIVSQAPVFTAHGAIKQGQDTAVGAYKMTLDSIAGKFGTGDIVTIDPATAGKTETAVIDRVNGSTLILMTALTQAHSAGAIVRVADLQPRQTTFRVQNAQALEPGSVIQMLPQEGSSPDYQVVETVSGELVTLAAPGLTNAYPMDSTVANFQPVNVTSREFSLSIGPAEKFDELSMDPRHSRYWRAVVNSNYVDVSLPAPADASLQAPPNNQPWYGNTGSGAQSLQGGKADSPGTLQLSDYQAGLDALVPIQDVQLVCIPDRLPDDQANAVQQAIVTHCASLGDRFAILDAKPGLAADATPGSDLLTQRSSCDSPGGYASFYYPRILISDPNGRTASDTLVVPACGHLAGVYARVDAQRGVHKAPANEFINGAVGLETSSIDSSTLGLLNLVGIDVTRILPGEARPIVWGARTTAPKGQTAWMYNSVRRLFIYVETSLKNGLRSWVFEPNGPGLWKKLDRTITEFLTRVWRSGALVGNKASDAFYVKIDEELNPPQVQALGQVIIEIGMAVVYPAEFVIVRIGLWEGGASVTES
jgi:phage tail sheath protein FI